MGSRASEPAEASGGGGGVAQQLPAWAVLCKSVPGGNVTGLAWLSKLHLSARGRVLVPPGLSHPKGQGFSEQLLPLPAPGLWSWSDARVCRGYGGEGHVSLLSGQAVGRPADVAPVRAVDAEQGPP